MRRPKHLPLSQWPHVDHQAFEIAYTPGDLFDGTAGPGADLSSGTRRMIQTVYRRWLGFLTERQSTLCCAAACASKRLGMAEGS